jgi:hypothetical protein
MAIKLAACPNWGEIFFDAKAHRQVPFSAIVNSLMGDKPDIIDPIIVLSCIIWEDETSETQVDEIVTKVRIGGSYFSAKINSLKKRLQQLQQMVLRDYPQLHESIPSTDGIDIKKLGQQGLIMTDSCNTTQKVRRLLQHVIGGIVFFVGLPSPFP